MAPFSSEGSSFGVSNVCKILLGLGLLSYLLFISFPNHYILNCSPSSHDLFSQTKYKSFQSDHIHPTNLTHLVFGLLGSQKAWHHRRAYIESWWRVGATRGLLYLDAAPTLLPWSAASPRYRVSDDLRRLVEETRARAPVMIRMVHGIMEVMRDVGEEKEVRWLVMGDDDSVFFVDNMVDVLRTYDHTKYFYLGGQSEFVMSNYWFSFNQGFGGAGFILSYPLAKALANDMENCLRRYAHFNSADLITMVCIADLGVNLSPHKGIHQIDLHGDLSGFLSSHPKSPLLSLHHLDMVEPLFPTMDRYDSTRHLMKAAAADQSRMLQQTICHDRQRSWSLSVSWGYSTHIYERIMTRSYLQTPIETFKPWVGSETHRPLYMFNTRLPSNDPCEAPHVFFFKNVRTSSAGILTTYSRAAARGLPPCSLGGNNTADFISEIRVFSPATKRVEMDRSECCDIVSVSEAKAEVQIRECKLNEIIA